MCATPPLIAYSYPPLEAALLQGSSRKAIRMMNEEFTSSL